MVIDEDILLLLGPVSAVVHAVLVANGADEWTTMSYREIAAATGLGESTVKRHIRTLRSVHLIKSEPLWIDRKQTGNAYQTLGWCRR